MRISSVSPRGLSVGSLFGDTYSFVCDDFCFALKRLGRVKISAQVCL